MLIKKIKCNFIFSLSLQGTFSQSRTLYKILFSDKSIKYKVLGSYPTILKIRKDRSYKGLYSALNSNLNKCTQTQQVALQLEYPVFGQYGLEGYATKYGRGRIGALSSEILFMLARDPISTPLEANRGLSQYINFFSIHTQNHVIPFDRLLLRWVYIRNALSWYLSFSEVKYTVDFEESDIIFNNQPQDDVQSLVYDSLSDVSDTNLPTTASDLVVVEDKPVLYNIVKRRFNNYFYYNFDQLFFTITPKVHANCLKVYSLISLSIKSQFSEDLLEQGIPLEAEDTFDFWRQYKIFYLQNLLTILLITLIKLKTAAKKYFFFFFFKFFRRQRRLSKRFKFISMTNSLYSLYRPEFLWKTLNPILMNKRGEAKVDIGFFKFISYNYFFYIFNQYKNQFFKNKQLTYTYPLVYNKLPKVARLLLNKYKYLKKGIKREVFWKTLAPKPGLLVIKRNRIIADRVKRLSKMPWHFELSKILFLKLSLRLLKFTKKSLPYAERARARLEPRDPSKIPKPFRIRKITRRYIKYFRKAVRALTYKTITSFDTPNRYEIHPIMHAAYWDVIVRRQFGSYLQTGKRSLIGSSINKHLFKHVYQITESVTFLNFLHLLIQIRASFSTLPLVVINRKKLLSIIKGRLPTSKKLKIIKSWLAPKRKKKVIKQKLDISPNNQLLALFFSQRYGNFWNTRQAFFTEIFMFYKIYSNRSNSNYLKSLLVTSYWKTLKSDLSNLFLTGRGEFKYSLRTKKKNHKSFFGEYHDYFLFVRSMFIRFFKYNSLELSQDAHLTAKLPLNKFRRHQLMRRFSIFDYYKQLSTLKQTANQYLDNSKFRERIFTLQPAEISILLIANIQDSWSRPRVGTSAQEYIILLQRFSFFFFNVYNKYFVYSNELQREIKFWVTWSIATKWNNKTNTYAYNTTMNYLKSALNKKHTYSYERDWVKNTFLLLLSNLNKHVFNIFKTKYNPNSRTYLQLFKTFQYALHKNEMRHGYLQHDSYNEETQSNHFNFFGLFKRRGEILHELVLNLKLLNLEEKLIITIIQELCCSLLLDDNSVYLVLMKNKVLGCFYDLNELIFIFIKKYRIIDIIWLNELFEHLFLSFFFFKSRRLLYIHARLDTVHYSQHFILYRTTDSLFVRNYNVFLVIGRLGKPQNSTYSALFNCDMANYSRSSQALVSFNTFFCVEFNVHDLKFDLSICSPLSEEFLGVFKKSSVWLYATNELYFSTYLTKIKNCNFHFYQSCLRPTCKLILFYFQTRFLNFVKYTKIFKAFYIDFESTKSRAYLLSLNIVLTTLFDLNNIRTNFTKFYNILEITFNFFWKWYRWKITDETKPVNFRGDRYQLNVKFTVYLQLLIKLIDLVHNFICLLQSISEFIMLINDETPKVANNFIKLIKYKIICEFSSVELDASCIQSTRDMLGTIERFSLLTVNVYKLFSTHRRNSRFTERVLYYLIFDPSWNTVFDGFIIAECFRNLHVADYFAFLQEKTSRELEDNDYNELIDDFICDLDYLYCFWSQNPNVFFKLNLNRVLHFSNRKFVLFNTVDYLDEGEGVFETFSLSQPTLLSVFHDVLDDDNFEFSPESGVVNVPYWGTFIKQELTYGQWLFNVHYRSRCTLIDEFCLRKWFNCKKRDFWSCYYKNHYLTIDHNFFQDNLCRGGVVWHTLFKVSLFKLMPILLKNFLNRAGEFKKILRKNFFKKYYNYMIFTAQIPRTRRLLLASQSAGVFAVDSLQIGEHTTSFIQENLYSSWFRKYVRHDKKEAGRYFNSIFFIRHERKHDILNIGIAAVMSNIHVLYTLTDFNMKNYSLLTRTNATFDMFFVKSNVDHFKAHRITNMPPKFITERPTVTKFTDLNSTYDFYAFYYNNAAAPLEDTFFFNQRIFDNFLVDSSYRNILAAHKLRAKLQRELWSSKEADYFKQYYWLETYTDEPINEAYETRKDLLIKRTTTRFENIFPRPIRKPRV